jgi:hypothetical protein
MSEDKQLTEGSRATRNAALRPDLVFRESPHDSCLVFARPERAAAVDRIHRAMESATWEEFRPRMDPMEYARLRAILSTVDSNELDGALVDAARLPSGALQDDIAVIVAGPQGIRT